jgi:hypothetical protein
LIDTLIYAVLTKASNLASHLRTGSSTWRVYPTGSLGYGGVPATPDRPYAQHGQSSNRLNLTVRNTRDSRSLLWDVFVYDNPGSFTRIRDIHEIIQDNMFDMEGQVSSDLWRVTDQRLWNMGHDVFDPVSRLNSVRATYLIVASHS